MVKQLQPLVRRERRAQSFARRAGELRRRLLAEAPEALARTLEIGSGSRVGVHQETHREPDDDRLHARLEQRDPDRRPERQVQESTPNAERLREQDGAEERDGHEQRRDGDVVRVDGGDDAQGQKVVDDDDREHERAQPVGKAGPDNREQAEGEGGVGRHRNAPPMHGRPTNVEEEVDRDGNRHAADPRQQWQRKPSALPQLAEVELASRLESDDEEEEGHQAAVHPFAEPERHPGATHLDRQRRSPHGVVRRRVDVHPHQRGDGRSEQDRRATRLGADELAQRRLEVPRPRRPLRERCRLSLGRHGAVGDRTDLRLLLVVLDDLRPPDVGGLRVPPGLAQCAPLPQQVPALVERDLDVLQAPSVGLGGFPG